MRLVDDRFEYHFVCHGLKERNRASRMFTKEKGTIAWIDRELRADDVFFDIGANIGVYTIFAARRLGNAGAVFAFEPHIPNANSLIANVLRNGLEQKVHLLSMALTNCEGYERFNYHSLYAAASTSQYGTTSYEYGKFDPVFVELKHGCTVDGLCERGIVPTPSIVKIDIDGLDFEVLEGMLGVMSSPDGPRTIQVELGLKKRSQILKLCEEAGYALQEKHWTQAGLAHIAAGGDPESTPYNAIFRRSRNG